MTFEIKKICDIEKSLNSDLLLSIKPEHWKIDTLRQKIYNAHKFTETIRIRHVRDLDFNNFRFLNYQTFDYYKDLIQKYLNKLSEFFNIKDYTALIVNLKPKGKIDPHIDMDSRYFEFGRRLHIPLKTNKDVLFTVGETKINMEIGKIYEINNQKIHSVENNSEENRIHLIIDIFEKNIKECREYWMN